MSFRLLATCLLLLPLASGATPLAAPPGAGEVIVRRVPNGGIQPEVALDAQGVLHMLYFAGEPAAGDLFYVRSADMGATFSTPVRVNSQHGSAVATGTIRGGQMALGRGGRVHVTWNGSDAAEPRGAVNPDMKRAGAPFLYARSSTDGTRFEPQRNLSPRLYSLDGGGSVAADGQGRVFAAWHGNREGEPRGEDHRRVWLATSADDGATFAPERALGQGHGVCGCCQLRAFAPPGSGLAVMYRAATGGTHRDIRLLASRDGREHFAESRVHPWEINACPMTSMSLASAGGRTLAAWETKGQVYVGAVHAGPAGITSPVAAPGDGGGRKHPRLAAAADGRTLLVWTEKTGWAKGGSIAWQVFDGGGRPAGASGAAPSSPVWSFATAVARPQGGFVIFY